MKIYTVYSKGDEVIPVEESFSMMGFLFGVFWTLYHRLWSFSIMCIAFQLIVGILNSQDLLSNAMMSMVSIIINLLIGCFGNDFIRSKLMNQKYNLLSITYAQNEDNALYNCLKEKNVNTI